MRQFIFLFLISILVSAAHAQGGTSHNGLNLYRYQVPLNGMDASSNLMLLHWLNEREVDIAGVNWDAGYVELIVSETEILTLNARGIIGTAIESNAVGTTQMTRADERYLSPVEVEIELRQIASMAPGLTRLDVIGNSFLGRPIYGLLLSTTPDLNSPEYYKKPTLIIDGMHHARELITPEIPIEFARSLISALYYDSWLAHAILENWNIWIVPMLNVDGNQIVWDHNSYWRKNARADGNWTHGVDLNRNYAYRFADCRGSSGNKSSETYRGDHAVSEPETQAILGLAELVRPAAYVSYHSFSELVLIPYGCTGSRTPEHQFFESLALGMSEQLPRMSGRGKYRWGTGWELLYATDGESTSHMYAEYGAISVTVEVGTSFHPDYKHRDHLVSTQMNGLVWLVAEMTNNVLSVEAVDKRTGGPLRAQVDIFPIEHKQGEQPFLTNIGGTFFKVLGPGEYQVRVHTADGRTDERSLLMDGQPRHLRFEF